MSGPDQFSRLQHRTRIGAHCAQLVAYDLAADWSMIELEAAMIVADVGTRFDAST